MTVEKALEVLIAKRGLGKLLGQVAAICYNEARAAGELRHKKNERSWHIAGQRLEELARGKNTAELDIVLCYRREQKARLAQAQVDAILDEG